MQIIYDQASPAGGVKVARRFTRRDSPDPYRAPAIRSAGLNARGGSNPTVQAKRQVLLYGGNRPNDRTLRHSPRADFVASSIKSASAPAPARPPAEERIHRSLTTQQKDWGTRRCAERPSLHFLSRSRHSRPHLRPTRFFRIRRKYRARSNADVRHGNVSNLGVPGITSI